MATAPTIVSIAHAAGNRRDRIARALAADVDLIEIDVRWWHETAWVRHERRLPFVPVLYDRDLRGVHRGGPHAFTLGRYFVRLEFRGLRFRDAVALVGDRVGLLVDLKAAPYRTSEARRFIADLLRTLARFPGTLDFCGGWPLLDLVTEARPGQLVHYSVDNAGHWEALLRRIEAGRAPAGISIHPRLLDGERAERLRRVGIDFYCWDIADAPAAEQAIALGASGIIADDLDLLAALRGTPVRTGGGA